MSRYRVILEATTYSVMLADRDGAEKTTYIGDVQRLPDGWRAVPYMHLGRNLGSFPDKHKAVAALVTRHVEREKKEE